MYFLTLTKRIRKSLQRKKCSLTYFAVRYTLYNGAFSIPCQYVLEYWFAKCELKKCVQHNFCSLMRDLKSMYIVELEKSSIWAVKKIVLFLGFELRLLKYGKIYVKNRKVTIFYKKKKILTPWRKVNFSFYLPFQKFYFPQRVWEKFILYRPRE